MNNSVIYIFEVKTKKHYGFGQPYEAVTPTKAKRLILMGEKVRLAK
ncbi:YraN family protein [Candidatus Roizmanbacteria bacterium]|nr:MAG: YraN family protein [Candidatus Roizmanbacteria bacterium]